MTFTAAVKDMPRYRGVMPDIAVEPSMSDYLSGKDPVLERALALCAASGADRSSWNAVSEPGLDAGLETMRPYSARSALTGSTRVARLAGR